MLDTSSAVQADEGTKTVKAICRMCHGGCGTIVSIKNGVVQSVVGDPDNPVNYGKLCSKAGKASLEQLYHDDRIDRPMMRVGEKGGGRWKHVSWDEAISFIAQKMLAIRAEFGAEAVTFARGVSMNNNQIVTRLANVFGTPNIASINYYCYGPRVAACSATSSGTFSGRIWDTVAIPDFFNAPNCIVEWGSQKRISNDHGLIGHTPVTQALRRKPVSIIVDPRKPAACGPGDIWLALRPGTDAAMALAWINVIIEEELYDREFVANWCHGFEALRERAKQYRPEAVADITWCGAEDIRAAARAYARAKPATIAWGTGIDHIGLNAVQANRAIHLLMGLTGNIDVPGGNCFWPSPRLADTEHWHLLPPEQAAKRLGADRFKALTMRPTVYAHPPSVFRAILTDEAVSREGDDRRRQQSGDLLSEYGCGERRAQETGSARGQRNLHDADGRACRYRAAGRVQSRARRSAALHAYQGTDRHLHGYHHPIGGEHRRASLRLGLHRGAGPGAGLSRAFPLGRSLRRGSAATDGHDLGRVATTRLCRRTHALSQISGAGFRNAYGQVRALVDRVRAVGL